MRNKAVVLFLLAVLLFIIADVSAENNITDPAPQTEERAMERAKDYADAINHEFKNPEKIYAFLWSGFREEMGEEAFIDAFNKERSYPYITPLYIFFPDVSGKTDEGGYIITFLQAARIVGMTYDIEMVYENGDWFVKDWEEFPDGRYLEKFENIPYSLDWYYDLSKIEKGD